MKFVYLFLFFSVAWCGYIKENETKLDMLDEIEFSGSKCILRELGWIRQQSCWFCPELCLAAGATYICSDPLKELYYFRNRWVWRNIYNTIALFILNHAKDANDNAFFTEAEMIWVRELVSGLNHPIPIGSSVVIKYDGTLSLEVGGEVMFSKYVLRDEFHRVANRFKHEAYMKTFERPL